MEPFSLALTPRDIGLPVERTFELPDALDGNMPLFSTISNVNVQYDGLAGYD